MNEENMKIMEDNKGFIAALDQSGGSTPKALKAYGIDQDQYKNEEEMFDLIHQMRTRIITSPNFSSDKILGSILFEQTMDSKIDGKYTADFLWEEKGILPFLKVDQGLDEHKNGVQLMKPLSKLDDLLDRALERNIFGTKMRSVIKEANEEGIKSIVEQQFQVGKEILAKGLMPILEPEVDIHMENKEKAEEILKREILKALDSLDDSEKIMLKLSLPSKDNFYKELIEHPKVLRVVALSGGYSREDSNTLLEKNPGLIASFSRALVEGLSYDQSDEDFDRGLGGSIEEIYQASII